MGDLNCRNDNDRYESNHGYSIPVQVIIRWERTLRCLWRTDAHPSAHTYPQRTSLLSLQTKLAGRLALKKRSEQILRWSPSVQRATAELPHWVLQTAKL